MEGTIWCSSWTKNDLFCTREERASGEFERKKVSFKHLSISEPTSKRNVTRVLERCSFQSSLDAIGCYSDTFSNLTLGWIVQVSAHKLWAAGARSLQVGKHNPPSRMEGLCR